MSGLYGKILSRPDAVNVAHVVEHCHVLGPGDRFVVWTQGCPLRCPGCHNPQFQPFEDATWVSVECLAKRILGTAGIAGVTFLGGEPFAQARALAAVARQVRGADLTVMVYSGRTHEELLSGTIPDAMFLLEAADLLVDGPYKRELPTQKPWRGSDNQRLIALSHRYAGQVEGWNGESGQQFEVRVSADGGIEVLGIPPQSLAEALSLAHGERIFCARESLPVQGGQEAADQGRLAASSEGGGQRSGPLPPLLAELSAGMSGGERWSAPSLTATNSGRPSQQEESGDERVSSTRRGSTGPLTGVPLRPTRPAV
jgi:anaerobic ribonucleoside-triphosphate reductase activating protein